MIENLDADKHSLQELVIYGLKGMSAYIYHALQLGFESDELLDFISDTLGYLTKEHSLEDYIALVDKTGAIGVKAIELLDMANTTRFGNPEIAECAKYRYIKLNFGDVDGIPSCA